MTVSESKTKMITIGSRLLSINQAKQLLPGYDEVKELIELFRNHALQQNTDNPNTYYGEVTLPAHQRYYNNTISILGDRGSGKTSVLLTLKKELSDAKNADIILPIILPEHMSVASDTMGWILGYLDEEIKKIVKQIQNFEHTNRFGEYHNNCLNPDKNNLQYLYKMALKSYQLRKKDYYDKSHQGDDSIADYIENTKKIIHADQHLIVNVKNLIDEIVKTLKMVNKYNVEPLIVIIFDDVDISAEKCPDVLDTIRTYLSHQNVVVIVSGDSEVFSEALTIHFLEKENVKSTDYERNFTSNIGDQENSAISRRKIRSQEYLKKILPPSCRFNMQVINNDRKQDFYYEFVDGKKLPALKELINHVSNTNNKKRIKSVNIDVLYYSVFDNTPRGLINPYMYLYMKYNSNKKWVESEYYQFLQVLINSNSLIKEQKNVVSEFINIDANSGYNVDFDILESYFDSEFDDENEERPINNFERVHITDQYLVLFMLGKFLELISPIPQNTISTESDLLVKIINKQIGNDILPNIMDIRIMLDFYKGIKTLPRKALTNISIFSDRSTNRRSTYDVAFIRTLIRGNGSIDISMLNHIYKEDEEWVEKIIRYIFDNALSDQELISKVRNNYFKTYEIIEHLRFYQLNESINVKDQIESIFDMDTDLSSNKKVIELQGEILTNISEIMNGFLFYKELSGSGMIEPHKFDSIFTDLILLMSDIRTMYLNKSLLNSNNQKEGSKILVLSDDVIKDRLKNINMLAKEYGINDVLNMKDLSEVALIKAGNKLFEIAYLSEIYSDSYFHITNDEHESLEYLGYLKSLVNNLYQKYDKREQTIKKDFQTTWSRAIKSLPMEFRRVLAVRIMPHRSLEYTLKNLSEEIQNLRGNALINSREYTLKIIKDLENIIRSYQKELRATNTSELARYYYKTIVLSNNAIQKTLKNMIWMEALAEIQENRQNEDYMLLQKIKQQLTSANKYELSFGIKGYINSIIENGR